MKLTIEQQEKAIGLRQLLKSEPSEIGWEAYLDFTRAVAKMLDGLDTFVRPLEMKEAMDQAWNNFVNVWRGENERLILESIGDPALLDQVKNHPNCNKICRQILDRVRTQAAKSTGLGMTATNVDVTDILSKGMSDLV